MLIRLFRLSRFRWQTHRSDSCVPNLVPQRILEVVEVVILGLPRAVKGDHCDQVSGLRGGQVAQTARQRVARVRLRRRIGSVRELSVISASLVHRQSLVTFRNVETET